MGNGIVKNEYEAVKWYHKAAVQGDEYAQTNLGSCYYDGRGVAKNLAIGYMWTNLAAESGEVQANKNLKKFTLEMTPALIAEGQRLSREWNAKHQDPFAAP
jgi:TPR repeat protein